MLVLKRRNDQMDSLIVGEQNPFIPTCLETEATKNDSIKYSTEQKGSFLGWVHLKKMGRFMKRSYYILLEPKNKYVFGVSIG